ncbi:TetR/AcrR family transcriptional regulator [Tsukamurella sp. PLM1]|uniref:TetR/AcrR family transcriptional regulator n=1 Tax=Tsukamurella sp. PLM1 TaxID=2929795 RepID=UPI00206FDF09|nr:TetR/AcrR family transcriptional regulator [Tsukamurella sp. PLM1]BDH57587.1 transcriptional regulator [Tsukamurella sp. PLM1]
MPVERKSAPTPQARRRFLDAGLAVLGRHGHADLKLAAVCARAGATTGSFYHAFASWGEYTSELIAFWREDQSLRLIVEATAIADPRARLERLVEIGLSLDADSEAAIRVWAAHDPEVLTHLAEVDAIRLAAIRETYVAIVGDEARADEFARIAMYLLVGYQSGTLRSDAALELGYRTVIDAALAAVGAPPR